MKKWIASMADRVDYEFVAANEDQALMLAAIHYGLYVWRADESGKFIARDEGEEE